MLIQITGLVQLRLRPRGVQLPVCSTAVGYALWCIWETKISQASFYLVVLTLY